MSGPDGAGPDPGSGRTALVTGGAGFIGSATVRALVEAGWRVRVLDDFSTGREENLASCRGAVETLRGDVCDASLLRRGAQGAQAVFHLAAIASVARSIADPEATHRVNLDGTVAVLEAARRAGVERVVYASSAAVYGDEPTLPKVETMPPACLSPYALQKWASETYLALYERLYGIETVTLRYFNVYGPGQDPESEYASVIPLFVRAVLDDDPVRVFGDGEQTRDFVYIDDVVRANLLAVGAPAPADGPINVASGERTSVNRLLREIQECVGHEISVKYEAPRPGEVRHSCADSTRAREWLGFTPAVGLAAGLRGTIQSLPSGSG